MRITVEISVQDRVRQQVKSTEYRVQRPRHSAGAGKPNRESILGQLYSVPGTRYTVLVLMPCDYDPYPTQLMQMRQVMPGIHPPHVLDALFPSLPMDAHPCQLGW